MTKTADKTTTAETKDEPTQAPKPETRKGATETPKSDSETPNAKTDATAEKKTRKRRKPKITTLLRVVRHHNDWSISQVAEAIDKTTATISSWERAKHSVKDKDRAKLSSIFGLDESVLFNSEGMAVEWNEKDHGDVVASLTKGVLDSAQNRNSKTQEESQHRAPREESRCNVVYLRSGQPVHIPTGMSQEEKKNLIEIIKMVS